jgi:hypothetical protein
VGYVEQLLSSENKIDPPRVVPSQRLKNKVVKQLPMKKYKSSLKENECLEQANE